MNNADSALIPHHITKNITTLYGDPGAHWISNLPKFITTYEKKWQFKSGKCFPDAQFNIVLDVMQHNNVPAVFKCCFPNKEFKTEILSLEHYDGVGAVKLLKSDAENGAMLLEKITPGTLLEKITSIEVATKHAVDVCKKLHQPCNNSAFPTLLDWFEGFDQRLYKKFNNTPGPFEEKLIEKAKSLSDALISSQSKLVLLHGDLHYANLILKKDHYVAIDLKGVIGEAEFEIPLPRVTNLMAEKELLYRVDCWTEQSQFDRQRIYHWLFCKAVLAAWWTIEDSGLPSELTSCFLNVANTIENFL